MKRIYFIILSFFLLMINANALEVSSTHYIMYNLNDDTLVLSEKADEIINIASMTKIMTTLVAIEQIHDYEQKVIITEEMLMGLAAADASVVGFKIGDEITYTDLLYGAFLASGADATRALSISLAGSESEFANLMNKKVKELGLVNTNFVNTSGLDAENHYSSVNDVAQILKAALKNDLFKEIYQTKTYMAQSKNVIIRNTTFNSINHLELDMSYIIGGKTGYTKKAGRCLASTAYDDANDVYYLLVTAGAPSDFEELYHIQDTKKIYDYIFNTYQYYPLVKIGDELISLDTINSKEKYITFYSDINLSYYSNAFDYSKLTFDYEGLDILNYNIKVGSDIGTITVKYDNEVIDILDLKLNNKINFSILQYIFNNIYGVICALTIIIAMIFIIKKKAVSKV